MNNSQHEKMFLLDTSVLLQETDALLQFPNSTLILPLTVLEELDKMKSDRSEAGRNAREFSRKLDELRRRGNLSEGVVIAGVENCCLRVVRSENLPQGFRDFASDVADNIIILTAKKLQQEGYEVTFVSKDINARIKANLIGVPAQDLGVFVERGSNFYTGYLEVDLDPDTAKIISPKHLEELLKDQVLYANQFLLAWTDKAKDRYRLFRNSGAEGKVVEVRRNKDIWSFQGKNAKQQMALDLLTDDNIQLVCLVGPAGTGKTFLTLLAGLHKVIVQKQYSRLFVARPLVSLGADIGFIPGDLQEKLFHWMHPIYDNLEYLFNELRSKDELWDMLNNCRPPGVVRAKHNSSRHSFKGRHSGSDEPAYAYNTTVHDHVFMLQKRGILGLEAITYMRGRSIPRQFILIDEAQNLSAQEIKTIVSRAGEGTKVVLSGDPYQIDSPFLDFFSNGLTITAQKLKNQPLAASIVLEESERSPLARMAIKYL